ncbi:MAG: ferritin family protein [Thermoplasmatales archaeon]|nr:ferritin family protein [Thermoplasmatales archaeon]
MPDLKKLLEIAIKSEIDAAENYKKMADTTNIFLLKDKLNFLEKEEIGHRNLLEKLFSKKFPGEDINLPKGSEIPFPEFKVNKNMQLSDMIRKAMEAEKIASDYYKKMEGSLSKEEEKAMARYLASMEESHYYLLKSELEIAYNFELYDEVHEMMHIGP